MLGGVGRVIREDDPYPIYPQLHIRECLQHFSVSIIVLSAINKVMREPNIERITASHKGN